ncbi:MAG TPA: hypothetical protein H9983_02970 [Candidatus Kurthia intestinigallinarum]|nr:hypothetical protein [Candidatus Kurthia intestinigallinarum]
MTKKQYLRSRIKWILLYWLSIAAGVWLIKLFIAAPIHYLVPSITVVFSTLLIEWMTYRSWLKENKLGKGQQYR